MGRPAGLDRDQYELISPEGGPARSTLAVLARRDGTAARHHQRLTGAGIDTAYREGNLRVSVHLFNTPDNIDQLLGVLHTPPP